jgi:hypothetical protein
MADEKVEVQQEDGGSVFEQMRRAAQVKRPIYRFKIPPRVGEGVVETVGLVRLTIREEAAIAEAYKRSTQAMQLAKACLVEVNGVAVSDADDSREIAWAKFPPAVRALTLMAYNKLHLPEDTDVDLFLKSEEVQVA